MRCSLVWTPWCHKATASSALWHFLALPGVLMGWKKAGSCQPALFNAQETWEIGLFFVLTQPLELLSRPPCPFPSRICPLTFLRSRLLILDEKARKSARCNSTVLHTDTPRACGRPRQISILRATHPHLLVTTTTMSDPQINTDIPQSRFRETG